MKNHSIQVHNTDNIQLTQVPVGTTSSGGNSNSNNNNGLNNSAANSSTVQLSPASSISSLSSTNGVSANGQPQSGLSGTTPPQNNGNGMKSNFGLITIKSKNSNILATQKFVKLLTTQAAAQQQQQSNGTSPVDDTRLDLNGGGGIRANGLLQHSSSASAVGVSVGGGGGVTGNGGSLPSLVNLGILTPATSPRNGQTSSLLGGGNSNSSSSSGCSSMSSSSSSMESLPLTPVSPTIGKSEAFVGVAQDLMAAVGGVSLTGGGDVDDHNMSDDT